MKKILLFICLFFVFFATNALADEKKEESISDQFIIINKTVNKLAFYEDGRLVNEFSVATGANPASTPEGKYKVNVKWECPVYYKGHNGGCTPGNPLGPRWIGLDVPGTAGYTYGIHGNASPWSIGSYASAGCVRMHNWQVTQLFDIVKMNTPVVIIRSSDSFDEIAKQNGYVVKNAEKVNKEVTLIGETQAYYGSHEGLVLEDEVIDTAKVKIKEEIDGWLHIQAKKENEEKEYWVNTKNYVEGNIKKEEHYLALKEKTLIYDYASDEARKISTNRPYVFYSDIHVDDWYYVHFTKDRSGWIKNQELKEVSKREWNLQEKMPTYTKDMLSKFKQLEETNQRFWKDAIQFFS